MSSFEKYDILSESCRVALRWAWASALLRAGAREPDDVVVDSYDLYAGLRLAHGDGGELNIILRHFRIPPGAVPSRVVRSPFTADDLAAAERRLPADATPAFERRTLSVLENAAANLPPTEVVVDLRSLVGAFLNSSLPGTLGPGTPAAIDLADEFSKRGAGAALAQLVGRAYWDYLAGPYRDPPLGSGAQTSSAQQQSEAPAQARARPDLASFLAERFPWQPRTVDVPGYETDDPGRRRLTDVDGEPLAAPPDLIGIQAEVDAFAYLVTSKTLQPPLAVGMFGDWGSGKSYFLRSIQRRIDQLVTSPQTRTRPQHELPFYKHVVQIEFNAWQYVEGDLVASLVEHLFRNLRVSAADPDDLVAERQRFWLDELRKAGERREVAAAQRRQLADELAVTSQRLDRARQERQTVLADLERRRQEDPLTGWEPDEELRDAVQKASEQAGLPLMAKRADQLAEALAEARDTLRRAGPVLGALRTGGWRWTLALLGVLAVAPAATFILQQVAGGVSGGVGGVTALLAGAATYVKKADDLVRHRLEAIEQAREQLDAKLRVRQQQLDQEVTATVERLAEIDDQVRQAEEKERDLLSREDELREELARVTPGQVMHDFVVERLGSDDYRKHLGVPALVRRDLDRLSQLVEAQNRRLDAPDASLDHDEHAVNRIVLYIDDLDRCPTDVVVKVLQAVHLLLAFPLFVVVVAVDARWLAGSLREHFHHLQGNGASPADYLEKIFQLPYWVPPLSPELRRQMAEGVLLPNLALPGGDGDGREGGAALPIPADFDRLVGELFETADQEPWLEAARLTITPEELAAVGQLAPLLGDTPRSIKRFVNLYLVLKAIGRARGWLDGPDDDRGDAEAVLWLLALADGQPTLANDLFGAVERAEAGTTIREVTGRLPMTDQLDVTMRWLDDNASTADIPAETLTRWLPAIRQLSFHLRR